jgi:hypothetical protein
LAEAPPAAIAAATPKQVASTLCISNPPMFSFFDFVVLRFLLARAFHDGLQTPAPNTAPRTRCVS